MKRDELLETAKEMVCGQRQQDYGTPERNFETIADLWSSYLMKGEDHIDLLFLTARDVAAMMALLKIARIATGKGTEDSWIDLAGYAACGGEIDAR